MLNMSIPEISFEFFPPRDEAQTRRFWCTFGCLQTLNPSYISMTWGALGSASKASLDILEPLLKDSRVPVTAHLTCAGETRESLLDKIATLHGLGITRFLALRGDLPESSKNQSPSAANGLRHAAELVSLLNQAGAQDISVAAYPEAHPESPDWQNDIKQLKAKLDCGAQRAITQFFFEAESFLRFRDRAEAAGIHQALVPGILPIHDFAKVRGFSEKCGASMSPDLAKQFSGAQTKADKHELAVEHSLKLCQTLMAEGVDAFHIYTLNQSALAYDISAQLLSAGEQPERGPDVGAAA
ncbi:MAG: methylenetetrahydrofolate reductase [Granulosicoccus sp.]